MTLSRLSFYSAAAALILGVGMAQAQMGTVDGRTSSGALTGYTAGSPLDRRPIVPASAYAASLYTPGRYGSLAPPIFMTTINTPGIYGAYSFGVAPLTFNREPLFYDTANDREIIPAVTVTIAPLRNPGTAAGVPTMSVGTPSTAPAVPGSTALSTIPAQTPVVPALTTTVAPADTTARVIVRVPEDARLTFGGVPVAQPGRLRTFTTPALTPGQYYTYDIHATWNEDGRTVEKDRHIYVSAGATADVDFLSPPADQGTRELRTRPLPFAAPGAPALKPTLPPKRP
jgi:uncharacterized protein (TIGR03000 family)